MGTGRKSVLKRLLIAAPLLPMLGCYENHHHRDDVVVEEHRTVVVDAPPPPPPERIVVVQDGWYDDHRFAGEHYEIDHVNRGGRADRNVPRIAQEVSIGRGVITWRADRRCRVWITESEHDTVMWNGLVWPGEVIQVVPRHDRIFIGNSEVAHFDKMKNEIRYRVWSDGGRMER